MIADCVSSARGEAGRHSAVETKHPGCGQNAKQPDEAHHERGRQLVQRAPVQRVKELRAALISDRVYEQCKEYALDAAVDIDTQLSDDDAYQ